MKESLLRRTQAPLKINYVENVMFDSMKHSHRDVQMHMWDVQRNSSEQVFPHSFMIQEECDCNVCVCVCVCVCV